MEKKLKFGLGLQDPFTPFVEFEGKVNEPPAQIGAMALNTGVVLAIELMVIVSVSVQPFAPVAVTV